MENLDWIIIDRDTIKFNIPPTQSITPDDLPKVIETIYNYFSREKVDLIKITGRGPIWLYSAITHAIAHLTKAVAIYDAINNHYIIVVSHNPKYKIGQIINNL